VQVGIPSVFLSFLEKKNLTTRFHKTVTGLPGDEAF
jgi:hypothetical protein